MDASFEFVQIAKQTAKLRVCEFESRLEPIPKSRQNKTYLGTGSNRYFANASRIKLSKCECESNHVGHCECESNKKTANCESICELRTKKRVFKAFLSSRKKMQKKN